MSGQASRRWRGDEAAVEQGLDAAPPNALRIAVECMADALIVVEEGGAIVFANPAAERLFGRPHAELVGSPFGFPLVDGETTELDVVRPGGQPVVAELRAVAVDWDGRAAWLATLRDVTDRRLAEERARELERAEQARRQAEAANQAKSEFLAVMSHELRTPLNAILGYGDLLDMGLGGPLTERQRHQVSRIRGSAHHLLGLVNEVLDLARVEEGRLTVAHEPARIADAVEGAVQLVRPQLEERGLRLEVTCDPWETGLFVGDEDRVRQILVNLLSNAVKFTEPGGLVAVACTRLAGAPPGTRLPADGEWVSVAVRDTGRGISADQQEAIFAPFVQAQGGHTRPADGSGLGLAIARRLARLMQGELTVRSAVGEGSTFTLWLPGAGGPVADAPPGSAPALAGGDADPARVEPEGGTGDGERSARLQATAEVGAALRLAIDAIARRVVARLRTDPPVPGAPALSDAQLGDHVATLLADVATVLMAIEHSPGEPTSLLADGTAIQRFVAERHGMQRAPLGWTTAAIATEYAWLGEECERAVRGTIARLPEGVRADALQMLRRFLDQAAQVSVRALEREQERRARRGVTSDE